MQKKLSTILAIVLSIAGLTLAIFFRLRQKLNAVPIAVPRVQIERLDQKMFSCKNSEELATVLNENPSLTKKFFQLKGEDLRTTATRLLYLVRARDMQQLYEAVQAQYADLTKIESELSVAFSFIKAHFPEFNPPRVIAMVSGMQLDYYIDGDVVIIGLDYFLGAESKFKPIGLVPAALLHTYTSDYIVPKMLLLLLRSLVRFDPSDKTMLSQMIYYGRVFYCLKTALPGVEEHLIFDYTKGEVLEILENQGFIWEVFLDKKLLYSTKILENAKYLEPRDSVPEVYPDCPKQIAKWLGYALVNSYMHENRVSIRQLMCTVDAQEIFSKSRFKPYKYS